MERSTSRERHARAALLSIGLLVVSGACAVTLPVRRVPAPAASRSTAASGPTLKVPPGHYPSPGMCRVWIEGRPPGRQARQTTCAAAMANAPAGSVVLYRPTAAELHARHIDGKRAGVVVAVHVYVAEGGRYLRSEKP